LSQPTSPIMVVPVHVHGPSSGGTRSSSFPVPQLIPVLPLAAMPKSKTNQYPGRGDVSASLKSPGPENETPPVATHPDDHKQKYVEAQAFHASIMCWG
jgi:hypothetical protein